MISNEERRNMASSLRHDAAYGEGSLSEWWGRLQFIVLDEDDFPNPREVFKGLAALIDRQTCRNVSGDQNRFECSECGFEMPIWDGDGGWMAFYFCPDCGAEVVTDGD